MSRRHLTFICKGAKLVATLDAGTATTGLLIVSGGNELRSGPWGSQAQLAAKIAAAGFPVLRFDRRGVGDSEGTNSTFTDSGSDISAALRTFRAQLPALKHIVAFGNCDAASALMLMKGHGCDGLVLANPWTFAPQTGPEPQPDEPSPMMTPQRLRAHYLKRLADPRAVWRLLSGKVAFGTLTTSLRNAARPPAPPSTLAQQMASGLAEFGGPVTLLIAQRDRTAQTFMDHWDKADPRLRACPDASHSFVEPQARIWLQGQLLAALRGLP